MYPGKDGKKIFSHGANCQIFIYEMLKHFGYFIPKSYRSSDLWKDSTYTKKVENLRPLDIVFFNKSKNSYGAHIGLVIGENKIIHLSKIVGKPAIWSLDQFREYEKYNFYLGAKRPQESKPLL